MKPSQFKTRLPRTYKVLVATAVVALVPMIALALTRLLHLDNNTFVVLLQTFTPYLLLPAYGIAVFAILTRTKFVALISLLVVLCHILWVVIPQWSPAQGPSTEAKSAKQITLFSQNVLAWNDNPRSIAEEIKRTNPDIVFLQEASRQVVEEINATGVLDGYQFRVLQLTNNPDSIGTWSRYPLLNSKVVPMEVFPAIRAEVFVEDKSLVLWNIHTRPPPLEYGTLQDWQNDLIAARRALTKETGSTVAAGDFNAVNSHRPFRYILDDGWTEAHVHLGRGFARTWPSDSGFGGVIRIDHVLTRGDVEPTSIRETPSHGSDHRGLVTTIALV